MISYSTALSNFAKAFKEKDRGIAQSVYRDNVVKSSAFARIISTLKEQMAFMFYPKRLNDLNFLFLAQLGNSGELVDLLNKMLGFNNVSDADKETIKAILNMLKNAEKTFGLNGKTKSGSEQLYEKIAPVLEDKFKNEANRRFLNLLDFSVKMAGNNQRRIEQKPFKNDVGNFENLSRKELVSFFSPDVFYKLNEKQVAQLLQATANEYALSNGAHPCEVKIAGLSAPNGGITLGEYNPSEQTIEINSNFLSRLQEFKDSKNAYAPYQLLSTLIHETQHHVQTTNLNKKDSQLTPREKMACYALTEPNSNNYGEYLISTDELDARDSALSYLRQAAAEADDKQANELVSVYAVSKREEESRPKPPVSAKIETAFDNIYGKISNLEKAPYYYDYAKERNAVMDIMRGKAVSRERAPELERVLEKRKY